MVAKKGTPEYEVWIKTPGYVEYCNKIKESSIRRSQNPEWIRNNKEVGKKNSQNPEWHKKLIIAHQEMVKNPEWIRKHREVSQNPEWLRKNKEQCQKLALDPEWLRKNKEMHQNEEYKNKHKIAIRKVWEDPNFKNKHKVRMGEVTNTYEWQFKRKDGQVGGLWYGVVKYPSRTVYCELWNKDLWKRIDAFWDYKSSLSGLTKEDNKDKNGKCIALSRHHVYWQPKACCDYDNDKEQYIARINVGTAMKPNFINHYIKDNNPNKFVLLTSKEHGMISKDKLKWIKEFERIIEERGGKSYLTREKINLI
jgi:hypothetical protein